MSRETDIAWAAGLFEGEGCLSSSRRESHLRPSCVAVMSSTDKDVLERFCAIVGVGKVVSRSQSSKLSKKQAYFWRVGSTVDFFHVCSLFMPYFGERRAARATEIMLAVAEHKDQRYGPRLPLPDGAR